MSTAAFKVAVVTTGASLALKTFLLHFETIRARVKKGDFKTGQLLEWKVDRETHPAVMTVLKLSTLSFLPCFEIDKLSQCVKNAAENEPLFMALAVSLCLDAVPVAPWAAAAVTAYGISRWLHAAIMMAEYPPQPVRALSWLVGAIICASLAVSTLVTVMA